MCHKQDGHCPGPLRVFELVVLSRRLLLSTYFPADCVQAGAQAAQGIGPLAPMRSRKKSVSSADKALDSSSDPQL